MEEKDRKAAFKTFLGEGESSDMTEVPCAFSVCVLSRSRHISSRRHTVTFRSISISVTGVREATNKHDGGLNQTGASDEEAEREEERRREREVQTRLQLLCFLACRW